MYVVASDGVETQAKKLKPTVSLLKAKMLVENLQDTDYLGLNHGKRICLQQDKRNWNYW